MSNLIKADLYRIFNKKGLYIFSGICSVLFLLMIYMVHYPSFTYLDYLSFIQMLTSFIGLIIGTFVVGLVYNDDLRSKSLQSAIGFGMKRSQIVITKFIVALVVYLIISLGFLALILSAPYMFAIPQMPGILKSLLIMFFGEVTRGIIYMALSSVVVFGTQKPTFNTTVYLLLATGTVVNIAGMILNVGFIKNTFGNLGQYLPSNALSIFIAKLTSDVFSTQDFIIVIATIIISLIASIVVFNKKELEF